MDGNTFHAAIMEELDAAVRDRLTTHGLLNATLAFTATAIRMGSDPGASRQTLDLFITRLRDRVAKQTSA
jgi:hypothetical protein